MNGSLADLTDEELEKLTRSQATRLLNPLLIGGPVLVVMVALFAPVDVLDRFPSLAAFCHQMIAWFPFLGAHATRSNYPQVTTLVKCLSFSVLPVCLIGGWTVMWGIRHRVVERVRRRLLKPLAWWLAPLAVGLAVLALVANWWLTNEPSFCKGCTTRNRLGLAFIEAVAIMQIATAPALAALTIYVRSLRSSATQQRPSRRGNSLSRSHHVERVAPRIERRT